MSKTVVGIFDNIDYAEMAARQIKSQGLPTEDISIVSKKEDGSPEVKDNISDGTLYGGVIGGVGGLLVGAGALMVPGLGIIAAAGPIAGALTGGIAGGIIGGLVDLGIPEQEGKRYEEDIRHGKVLFSMKTEDDKVAAVSSILRNNGAISVRTH